LVFKTFGQTATYTGTVLPSPTPTTSGFRLDDIGTLRPQERIYVAVGGILTETQINTITGNDITVTPPLSVAPDVPGEVLSYAQPLYNDMLNRSADWSVADLTELAATPIAGMPDGTKVTVPGWGKGRLVLGGAAVPDGYAVVDANGPGQWVLDIPVPGYFDGFIENALSINDIADLKRRIEALENSAPKIIYYKQVTNGISIAANSHGNIPFVLNVPGQNIYPSDSVIVTPPIQYQGPGQPILGLPCIRAKNLLLINFYNPSGSPANNVGGGEWVFTFVKGAYSA
jgi:hypothetical protein